MKRTGLSQAAGQGSSYIHDAAQWTHLLEEPFMFPNVHTATVDSLPDVGDELLSCLLNQRLDLQPGSARALQSWPRPPRQSRPSAAFTMGNGRCCACAPATETASEGRARNRRVEVQITQSGSQAGKN
jgi:hypothetical protein